MSSINGSYIIQDGLVTYLDAANPNSYLGAGATWSDLYSTLQTTLVNGPLWDNAAGGTFIFDGVNDYISLYNHLPYQQFTHNFTIQVITMATSGYGRLLSDGSFQTNGIYHELSYSNTTFQVVINNNTTTPMYSALGYGGLTFGRIYDFTTTYNGYTMSLYVNGFLYSSTSAITISQSSVLTRFGTTNNPANIGLYRIGLYNTALNASQIMQNWMAIRNRFSNNKNNYYFYYLSLISGVNGAIEARDNLLNRTNTLIANNLLDTATFLMVPVGYTTSVIPSIIPNSLLSYGGLTFSRGSAATRINAAGNVETLGTNIPAFNYTTASIYPTLLLEPSRTNSIQNSTMVGASATTGALPTTWSYNTTGLSVSVVGTGVINGMNYIDVRYNGTSSSGGIWTRYAPYTIIATQSQSWNISAYLAIATGSKTNISSISFYLDELSSSGSYLTSRGGINLLSNLGSTLSFYSYTLNTINASCSYINNYLYAQVSTTQPIDITLRIAAPQLEYSNSYTASISSYATSFIPTTTTAVTRSLATFTKTGLYTSGLIGASSGTCYFEFQNVKQLTRDPSGGAFQLRTSDGLWALDIRNFPGNNFLSVMTVENTQNLVSAPLVAGTNKIIMSWTNSSVNIFLNGSAVITGRTFSSTQFDNFYILPGDVPRNVAQIGLWNYNLTDSQCSILTT